MNHKRLVFVVCIVLLLALVTTGLALAATPDILEVAGSWTTGFGITPTTSGTWTSGI